MQCKEIYMRTSIKGAFLVLALILSVLSISACSTTTVSSTVSDGSKGNLTATTLAILQIVVALIMLVSLFTLIIPGVPGITFIWVTALVYALVTGFEKPTWLYFGIISGLMLLGNVVDNLMMGAGARKGGAPWLTTLASILAAIIGSLVFPPFGGIIAAALVLFTLEVIRLKDSSTALRSTGELLKGFGCSFVVRFFIGMIMIALWVVWIIQAGQWLL